MSEAIADGVNIIVLSDWLSNEDLAPIPMLLATAAVHHHLIREKTRTKVGLIVETGEAREVHHFCLLMGYGAAAINPYLAFDTIEQHDQRACHRRSPTSTPAAKNYIKAAGKGMLKVMSKMGISTVASYTGAQIFEAIGLGEELIDEYFTGTGQPPGRHRPGRDRRGGPAPSRHAPTRSATRSRRTATWTTAASTSGAARASTTCSTPRPCSSCSTPPAAGSTRSSRSTRSWWTTSPSTWPPSAACSGSGRRSDRPSIPIDEVEPASEIVKRFSTGAMSYGSISAEAHETLAIAMNRLGGKSNTGEGGEDPSGSPRWRTATPSAPPSSRWPRAASA